MTFSHTSCTHPATSKDRAKCRKAASAINPDGSSVNTPLNDRITEGRKATSRATRNAKRTATEAVADEVAADIIDRETKKAKANAYRTAATQMKNPLKDRRDCYVCGSRSAHMDRKNGEPVCMKHIDNWDNVTIIPL